MKESASWLDSLVVASPCQASWSEMSGDERARFCSHCKLYVYNLSDMTRGEVESFLREREGRVCVRFHRRADGTLLSRDCPVGLRAVRLRLFRAVAALAGLIVAMATGTLFGGRASKSKPEAYQPPSQALAEWIDPGSTTIFTATMGAVCLPPPTGSGP